MSKLRSAYTMLSILGSVVVLLLRLAGLAIRFKLKIWYRFWRFKAGFKIVLKKRGIPEEVAEDLITEYERYLKKFSKAFKFRNLVKIISMYRRS